MASEEISLEELLGSQTNATAQATIERVDGDDTRVMVSPYLDATGCACDLSITVPKAAIASLRKTDAVHHCCGQRLAVVEVEFANEAHADVFTQLSAKLAERATHSVSHSVGTPPIRWGEYGHHLRQPLYPWHHIRPYLSCQQCEDNRGECFKNCMYLTGNERAACIEYCQASYRFCEIDCSRDP